MRLDQLLIDQGLVPSRTKAKELIEQGQVQLRINDVWSTIDTPSYPVDPAHPPEIRFSSSQLLRYVARSGLKLEGALEQLQLDVTNFFALDVGQSTGGFTDCLLQAGAKAVVGFDVGTGQLAEKLRDDPRVTYFEKLNAKDLAKSELANLKARFDLIVVDVSFISLLQVLPPTFPLLKAAGRILALVKPQFELGPEALNKKGIVKDLDKVSEVQEKLRDLLETSGIMVKDFFASPLTGRDGNQEFFIHAIKN